MEKDPVKEALAPSGNLKRKRKRKIQNEESNTSPARNPSYIPKTPYIKTSLPISGMRRRTKKGYTCAVKVCSYLLLLAFHRRPYLLSNLLLIASTRLRCCLTMSLMCRTLSNSVSRSSISRMIFLNRAISVSAFALLFAARIDCDVALWVVCRASCVHVNTVGKE